MSRDDDMQKIRSCLNKLGSFIGLSLNLAWLCVSLAFSCLASPLLVISSCCGAAFNCIGFALELALPSRIVSHKYYRMVIFIIALSIFIFGCCIAFPLYPVIDTIDCHPAVFYFAFVHYCSIIATVFFILTITSIGICVGGVVDDE
jgi:hypothetical protein